MNPTQELVHEHEIVKHALTILEQISAKLDAGDALNVEHLSRLFEFLTEFVDKCHHGKEEDVLFPMMSQTGSPPVKPMIAQMLSEHDAGRAFIKNMKQAFAQYQAGTADAGREFGQNANGYIELLRAHIAKEDGILYPFAETLLTDAQQAKLVEGFERIETERTGPGKHEEYHQMIHELEGVYVK